MQLLPETRTFVVEDPQDFPFQLFSPRDVARTGINQLAVATDLEDFLSLLLKKDKKTMLYCNYKKGESIYQGSRKVVWKKEKPERFFDQNLRAFLYVILD